MIRDLSLTLRAILEDPSLSTSFPELASALIVFDRPVESFNPAQTTIVLFLYDIRENMELRSNERTRLRSLGHVQTKAPPLRASCSYLVTAWPVGGADLQLQEQRLLSHVLEVFARYPHIPAAFLRGKLVGQEPPLPLVCAQPVGVTEPSEFWSAIGNKLRPSISISATIGLDVFAPVEEPSVGSHELRIGLRVDPQSDTLLPATRLQSFRIGGQVLGAAAAPVAGAQVTLVGTGAAAITATDGSYVIGSVATGTYTLRVRVGSVTHDQSVTIPAANADSYNVQL